MRGPAASAILADHGDEMLRRAVEIELELAVLIDGAERRDRRRPLAVLAEALAPELHIPGGEAREPVADRAASRWRVTPRSLARPTAMAAPMAGAKSAACTPSSSAATTRGRALPQRLDIEPARKRRQQPDIGERREAPADIRVMVERRNAEMRRTARASRWPCRTARLGEARNSSGMRVLEPGRAHGVDGGDGLHQGFGRVARFRDHHEARGLEVEPGKSELKRARVEIVVEARARPRLAAMLVVAGNAPAAELRQRLAAEARPAGAEEDQRRAPLASSVAAPRVQARCRRAVPARATAAACRRHGPRAARRAAAQAWSR